jgi:predicted amidohydrolase YtcJ
MGQMQNVLALTNGRVLTMEPGTPESDAILIEDGKITAMGGSREIEARCKALGGRVILLGQNVAVPGLHDCHVHMMGTGLNSLGIDMYDCASVADVLDKVAEAAKAYPENRWVFGKRLDESRLKEGRPPTAAELDAVAPGHSVYIVDRGWHYTLVNTRAFEMFGLTPDTQGVRRDAGRKINGRLHDQANAKAKMAFFELQDAEQRAAAFTFTAEEAARKGVTTLHAQEGGALFADSDIPILTELSAKLPVRVVLYWATEDHRKILDAGLRWWGGDILLDGSIGSRTAAFEAPYSDDPSTSGYLHYSDARVREFMVTALENGLQVAFHAIGQLAVRQAMDSLEYALSACPVQDHRTRIEHFGFPDISDVERAARLGAVISTQPSFTYLRGGPGTVYNQRLGDARERAGYPLRRFLDAGLVVGGGSDSDVTPIDPVLGMHAAVNPPYPENGVTPYEALAMFTIEAAKTAFEEDVKGSLRPGKLGDVTVLSRDPLKVPPDKIRDIEVVMTVKGGQVVYQR